MAGGMAGGLVKLSVIVVSKITLSRPSRMVRGR